MAKHVYRNLHLSNMISATNQVPSTTTAPQTSKASEFTLSSLSESSELRISRLSNFCILAPLSPGQSRPLGNNQVIFTSDPTDIKTTYASLTGLLSIDIETTGLNPRADQIVGIGFYAEGFPTYYLSTRTPLTQAQILDLLSPHFGRLVAYNCSFETQFLGLTKTYPNPWAYDAFILYKSLANEGWKGQKWGLKPAQIDLLSWDGRGDEELSGWLVDNGHFTSTSKVPKDGYILRTHDGETRYLNPDKSQMWRAPDEVLGYYCALDCQSTLDILTKVLLPAMEGQVWEETARSFHRLSLSNVTEITRNTSVGFTVDEEMVKSYITVLEGKIAQAWDGLYSRPEIIRLTGELLEHQADLKRAKEPKKLTKAGKVSKTWESWRVKLDELESDTDPRKWVNFGSGPQMQHLFYHMLQFPVKQRTKKGGPAVNDKALKGFGEMGAAMLAKRKLEKELGYVTACLTNMVGETA